MAQRKVYQSTHFIEFDTYVEVNGKKRLIQFRGGSLKPLINGKFITGDPDVIRAMDKSAGLGKDFKCISTETFSEKKEAKKAPEESPSDEPAEEKRESIKVTGINTIQAAREYLLANIPDLKPSQVPNGAAVKGVAAKNDIVFVDLP